MRWSNPALIFPAAIAQKGEKFFTYLNQAQFLNVKETTFWRENFSSLEVFHLRIRPSFAARDGQPGVLFSGAAIAQCPGQRWAVQCSARRSARHAPAADRSRAVLAGRRPAADGRAGSISTWPWKRTKRSRQDPRGERSSPRSAVNSSRRAVAVGMAAQRDTTAIPRNCPAFAFFSGLG